MAALRDSWLHPRYIGTIYLKRALAEIAPVVSGRLLDVGCGLRPYEPLFKSRVTSYVGIDRPLAARQANADVVGDALHLPLLERTVDTVLATELIEHLPEPDSFLAEVTRVLRPGGILILSAPLMEPLHEEPRDFYRFTPYGLTSLLERHRFKVTRIIARGGWWSVVVGSFVNQSLYNSISPVDASGKRRRRLLGFVVLPVCSLAQLIGYGLDRIIPSSRYTLGYVAVATYEAGRTIDGG